jgi:probable rRNA maturation factor
VTAPRRPPLQLSLQFADATHRQHLPRHRVARWVRAALQAPGEITVRIVGAEEGRELNRSYRGKDYATNVLTFDYSHAPQVHADLVLCAPVVAQEAAAQGLALDAHYAHLLVHGTLPRRAMTMKKARSRPGPWKTWKRASWSLWALPTLTR